MLAQLLHLGGLEAPLLARNASSSWLYSYRNAGGLANPDPTIGDPLGTWAHRVFRFGPGAGKISAPTHIPGTPEVAEIRSRVSQQGKGRPFREDCEDDDAAEAAWRWRFNRRWRSEQVKPSCSTQSCSVLSLTGVCGPLQTLVQDCFNIPAVVTHDMLAASSQTAQTCQKKPRCSMM